MTPELWRNYGTTYYVKKTAVVALLPVVDLSGKSAFLFFFFEGDATQVLRKNIYFEVVRLL